MKIKIKRKPLLAAINKCLPLAKKKTLPEITSHVLMTYAAATSSEVTSSGVTSSEAGESQTLTLQLSATDMETFLYVEIGDHIIDVDGNERMNWALPGEQFGKLILSLQGEEVGITFSSKRRTAILKDDAVNGSFKLNIMPGADFPVPEIEANSPASSFKFNNDCGVIRRALARNTGSREKAAAFAKDSSEVVGFFSFDKSEKGGDLLVANTDGYVGAFETLKFDDEPVRSVPFGINIDEAKILAGLEGDINVEVLGYFIRCSAGDVSVVLRSVELNAESIRDMFSGANDYINGCQNQIAVNKRDILSAMTRVLLCADAELTGVSIGLRMHINEARILIMLQDDNRTVEAIEDIDTALEDDIRGNDDLLGDNGVNFIFDPSLMKRILAELGDEVEFSFSVNNSDVNNSDVNNRVIEFMGIKDYDNEDFRGFLAGRAG